MPPLQDSAKNIPRICEASFEVLFFFNYASNLFHQNLNGEVFSSLKGPIPRAFETMDMYFTLPILCLFEMCGPTHNHDLKVESNLISFHEMNQPIFFP